MNSAFSTLINRHLVFAFDRQLQLPEVVDGLSWGYDLDSGLLSFGDRHHWQAEVLGSESNQSSTWLWAWANEASGIPDDRQGVSHKLKMIGEKHGIAEFTEPIVSLGTETVSDTVFVPVFVRSEGIRCTRYRQP